ncbi:Fic family protein [Paenibacillus crassostreae]|uniref:Fic/DOC family protein n=1 Tax=Paenibacillus crassostreae TaxID=1763538 RepID=A0A167E1X0_9BACL|nr:Fic family protein [Paenibacillus crassostreae]AOZ93320.1 Fic/DOC family protein [Paenibacillus crassostreae]OAB75035.1 Fic/DOC family protein [Paenibacillus crassostreae]
MAAVKGIKKLPVVVPQAHIYDLLMKLSGVTEKLGRLDEKFKKSILRTDFINTLALKESVQSTRIEGTQVTFTDMVEQAHKQHTKSEHKEVQNYQDALRIGHERILNGYPISTRLILELHTILMDGARGTNVSKGEFRKIQNFIGPTNRIEDAVYIPVPAQEIGDYMENWELYANKHPYGDKLPHPKLKENEVVIDENAQALLKVAILHAQFESIHPFLDGNGRLGRILIAIYMVQSQLVSSPIFFVSEELEKQRARYYHLLNSVRGNDPDWISWIKFFINACDRMADKLSALLDRAEQLANEGLDKCDRQLQRDVFIYTFREPNTTAVQVSVHFGVAITTARKALNELSDLGLIFKNTSQLRNIEYFNYDVLDLLN